MPEREPYYVSAASAARAARVSPKTIAQAVRSGQIEGAYQNEDGWYRVPVRGLRELGYSVTGEGSRIIGPLSNDPRVRRLPQPDEEDQLFVFWYGDGTPAVRFNKETRGIDFVGGSPVLNTPQESRKLGETLRAVAEWVELQGAPEDL